MDREYGEAERRWRATPRDPSAIEGLVHVCRRAGLPLPLALDPVRLLGAYVDQVHREIQLENDSGYNYTAVGGVVALCPPFDDRQAMCAAINQLPLLFNAFAQQSDEEAEPQGLVFPCAAVESVDALEPEDLREGFDEGPLGKALLAFPGARLFTVEAHYPETNPVYSLYTVSTLLVWLPIVEHAHLLVTQHHWGCWTPPEGE